MLKNLLKERNIPQFKSCEEMLDIVLREEYGYIPDKPSAISFEEYNNYIPDFCAGKAISKKVTIKSKICDKEFIFPVYVSIPNNAGKHPFFVCINFRDCVPDRYVPVEEIIDNGFAVLSFCYEDITKDNDDFTDGLAGVLYENGKRGKKRGRQNRFMVMGRTASDGLRSNAWQS